MHGVAAEAHPVNGSWVRLYDKGDHVAMHCDVPAHLTPAACRYLASKLRRLAKIVEERQG